MVLTRQGNWHEDGVQALQNLDDALHYCEQLQPAPQAVWIIGGAQIYAQAIAVAHKIVITDINASFDGDAFAPLLDASWREVQREPHISATGLAYSFVTYLPSAAI